MSDLQLLIQEEFPGIVAGGGAFGKNVSFASFEINNDHVAVKLYMSTVTFGTITTSDGSRYSIIFKMKPRDPVKITTFKINEQFHNEILMYERAVPFLLTCHDPTVGHKNVLPSLPRYYYGRNKCGEFIEKDLIVLENVSPLGYRMCDESIFLDYDHLLIAIQALAKFHALSYTAKYRDPVGFQKIFVDLRDTVWDDYGRWNNKKDLAKFGKRAVDRLLERDVDRYGDDERLRQFEELIAGGDGSLRRALRPREPLSVLCHGDFNRNNVMFRYGVDGRPVDAMLFDFGTPRYGSPALDLSFFLYLNTTRETRRDRYGDLIDAYCATLASAVPPGVRVPDRDDVHAEMSSSALFGVATVLFFLPMVLHDQADVSRLLDEHADNPIDGYLLFGGDVATERVADIVQHFIDMGYANFR